MRRKSELPEKVCVVCGRPFVWRRKWARDWDAVRYCSERCRRQARHGRPSERGSGAGASGAGERGSGESGSGAAASG